MTHYDAYRRGSNGPEYVGKFSTQSAARAAAGSDGFIRPTSTWY